MNYIGSKRSLLDFLDESITKMTKGDFETVCDLFAGTGVVGSYFKSKGHSVVANDIQYYSYVLNRHYIGTKKKLQFKGLKDQLELGSDPMASVCVYLDTLPGKKGFIYKNYCMGGTKGKEHERQYFSDINGMRGDAIRQKIESWKEEKRITKDEYFFLLASLIEAMDKVANTASVYGAYLKALKKSAQKAFVLEPLPVIVGAGTYQVFNADINVLVNKVSSDVVYLDPPYNQRQYATNYHVLETIARYDAPKLFGKTGLRDYEEQKSRYCSRATVKEAFADLIANLDAKYIFLSYNNEGLMTEEDVKQIMKTRGEYKLFSKAYRRFKADKDDARNHKDIKTVEYLHALKVTK